MFQFRRFPTYAYLIQRTSLKYCFSRFPHSEIPGSMDICSSPRLIAACHVLHRLLMPRHSPCALYSLTYRIFADPLVELCRLSRDFWLNCIYPASFRMRSTIKTYFSRSFDPDLSVALHCHFLHSLFSFQGAIASDRLRSEISS